MQSARSVLHAFIVCAVFYAIFIVLTLINVSLDRTEEQNREQD